MLLSQEIAKQLRAFLIHDREREELSVHCFGVVEQPNRRPTPMLGDRGVFETAFLKASVLVSNTG